MEVLTIVGNKDSIYLPKTIEISYDQRHKQQDKRIRIRNVSFPPAARLPIGADGETLRQWEPFSHCNPYPIVAGV